MSGFSYRFRLPLFLSLKIVWCRKQDFWNWNCTVKTWKKSLSKHLKIAAWTILDCRSDSSSCTNFQIGPWQVQRQVPWLRQDQGLAHADKRDRLSSNTVGILRRWKKTTCVFKQWRLTAKFINQNLNLHIAESLNFSFFFSPIKLFEQMFRGQLGLLKTLLKCCIYSENIKRSYEIATTKETNQDY